MPPEIIVLEYKNGPFKYMYFWPRNGMSFTADELAVVRWQIDNRDCHKVQDKRARALYRQWRPIAVQDLKKLYHGKPPRSAVPVEIDEETAEWNWNKAPMRAVVSCER
jgi:hypothetical protein